MKIKRAYKTELDPNNVQRTALLKHAGAARFAYNWGLARRREEYERTGRSSNAIGLHRQLNALKNHCLAKQLADAGIGEFLRQLRYKTKWYGGKVIEADPFFPSTKRCSNCGAAKDEMPLSERTYKCGSCGFEADRDLNAAMNLASVAASWAETQNACESGEVHAAGQVLPCEAGTERHLGGVLNG